MPTGKITIRAVRNIHAGEEISIAYTDIGPPVHIRQAQLLTSHGFVCDCEACGGAERAGCSWLCQHNQAGTMRCPQSL
jgi:hypothetical protein